MYINNKIKELEDKLDKFIYDVNNELKSLKEKAIENHPTAYERIRKIIYDAKSMKRKIISITISQDIEFEIIRQIPLICISPYSPMEIMGIPVKVDKTCYDTITAIIK